MPRVYVGIDADDCRGSRRDHGADVGQAGGRRGRCRGVVVAGAAVGLAAERYAVGRSFRKASDPEADEPFGGLRGAVVPVTATDGVALHVEVDGPLPSARATPPVTVVFSHGLALTQDSWHYQRRDLSDLADDGAGWCSGTSAVTAGPARGPAEHATIDQLGRDLRPVITATAPARTAGAGRPLDGRHDDHGAGRPGAGPVRQAGDRRGAGGDVTGRLAEVTFGAPAAAVRVLRRAAPKALAALNRRPALVARGPRRWVPTSSSC